MRFVERHRETGIWAFRVGKRTWLEVGSHWPKLGPDRISCGGLKWFALTSRLAVVSYSQNFLDMGFYDA